MTRKQTYKNLSNWYKELQENRKGIPVIVVANKIDGKETTFFFKKENSTNRSKLIIK